ncbi:MAG: hypothetical protein WC291_00170 [Thermodesulfovibrionales bacterium]|jgi:hypothetical protein
MIRVTIEMVPFGIEAAKRPISTIQIVNTMEGTHEVGNYRAIIYENGEKKKAVEVKGFVRSRGAVQLLKEVLKKVRSNAR